MSLFIDKKLIKKLQSASKNSKQAIKTWSRKAVISPEMIGYSLLVHNGKEFIKVGPIHEAMVGHKLGEFAATTKFIGHGGKKAAEEEKKIQEKEKEKLKQEKDEQVQSTA